MALAQKVSSMVLALRRKVNIKVRQPLSRILIPVLDPVLKEHIEAVKSLILNEVNIKQLEFIEDTTGVITKRIKPNFKTLGPRYGKQMKQISALVAGFSQADIAQLERTDSWTAEIDGVKIEATAADFDITSEDMPGWLVAAEGKLTVAMDITVTEEPEARRNGTGIGKPYPEHPKRERVRSHGQNPDNDRQERSNRRSGRIVRRLYRRANAGGKYFLSRFDNRSRHAKHRVGRFDSQHIGQKSITCGRLFSGVTAKNFCRFVN